MHEMLVAFLIFAIIVIYLLWRMLRLLANIKDNTRDAAFHTRRIPVDPNDRL